MLRLKHKVKISLTLWRPLATVAICVHRASCARPG